MNDKVYIYALREAGNPEIRYIGKTVDPKVRLASHLSDGQIESGNPKQRWIGEMYAIGCQIEMDVLEECDNTSWEEREYYWILHYLNAGNRLTNTIGVETDWITKHGQSRQVAISLSRRMQPVIDEAMRTFPESKSPAQALTRALLDWYSSYQEEYQFDGAYDASAMARMEDELAEIKQLLHQLLARNQATEKIIDQALDELKIDAPWGENHAES